MAALAFRSDGVSAREGSLIEFVDTLLRGVGQVMLQNNAYTGALFLVGIFYNSVLFGIAAIVGTLVSTTTAVLLGVDRQLVRAGLFGFNGTLVAIALIHFLEPNVVSWACLVVAAAFASVAMAALTSLWSKCNGSALTAPFVLTAWAFLLASTYFSRLPSTTLPTATLPKAVAVQGVVTASMVWEGLFKGVGQVFFQDSVVTGIVFLFGLVVSSRIASLAALLGSLVGLLVAWGLGAPVSDIRLGLYGFNSTLTAIALGGTLFAVDARSILLVPIGVIVTAVVFAALSAALQPMGMVALTAPFVLVTWGFLLAKPLLSAREPQPESDGELTR